MALHHDLTGAAALHQIAHHSDTDPTTTLGPYKAWFAPTSGTLKIRNGANSAWLPVTDVTAATAIANHITDALDAHDASAISVLDTDGNFAGTNAETVLAELYDAIVAGGGATDLEGLSDVDLTSPAARQSLYYDGSNFVNAYDPGQSQAPIAKSANFTASASEFSYHVNATSGALTATLPSAVGLSGKVFKIRKVDSGTNAVSIVPTGAETINGASSLSLTRQYQAKSFESNGTMWLVNTTQKGTSTPDADTLDDLTDVNAPSPSDGDVLTYDSGSGDWINGAPSGGSGGSQVDLYTSGTPTWTKPSGAVAVTVVAIGGGGGGGSGRRGGASSVRGGGAGGAGGSMSRADIDASTLPSTVALTVGAGGPGGAAQTTNSTVGNGGTQGGASYFGTSGSYRCYANGGAAGSGGTNGSASGGAGGGTNYANGMFTGGQGGGGTSTANGGDGTAAQGAGGGAGGAPIDVSNVVYAGGTGGLGGGVSGGAGGSNAGGSAGTVGYSAGGGHVGGGGGGGGGGDTAGTVAGGTGAVGGAYGGGGGGGGASTNGANSGAGGAGSAGSVLVITHF